MSNPPRLIPSYPTQAALLVEWGSDCWFGEFCVIGQRPMANAANRRPLDDGEPKPVKIGDRTIIGSHCVVYRDVQMGEDCRLGDHATIREGARIGKRCVIGTMVDLQYNVTLADDVRILNQTQIAGGSVIGRGTFIGPGVQTANDPHVAKHGLEDYQDRGQVGVTIGEFVFIGVGAILLPGVKIGDRAIIGAGALVTKDVPLGATVLAPGVCGRPVGEFKEVYSPKYGRTLPLFYLDEEEREEAKRYTDDAAWREQCVAGAVSAGVVTPNEARAALGLLSI